ncbi:MAG: hypothetical protein EAZ78_22780 [Oscillatoriales cyanobacterium]|uniref:Uncharacterized protein n=1 Tax=Microcoleus anatoxicus PTRS2 TaxID=2705321 RepID=A0ABU8YK35_9CYAN|nr:MAG: hypothetical protein EA000_13845 [Oscillatoriales cyanobacterium]TAE99170.1 MAG: hypothetical protein EAZ78_22780 [Oscillatoriales cyanobacterium]TAF36589.1 MAG: hypothetical protein EAZ68_16430 [Oscillatoriales cyanobacterium]TAF69664.1 MAG: hypothetical protein EAZ59_07830 [Oscillatoriales cyanobacterium]
MNTEENATVTASINKVSLPKSKQELLAEQSEKALGQQKQDNANTMRAVEQLKEEMQHKVDEECHHHT